MRDARYYSAVNKVAKTIVDLIEQVVLLAADHRERQQPGLFVDDFFNDLLAALQTAALVRCQRFDTDLYRMIADAARKELLKRAEAAR